VQSHHLCCASRTNGDQREWWDGAALVPPYIGRRRRGLDQQRPDQRADFAPGCGAPTVPDRTAERRGIIRSRRLPGQGRGIVRKHDERAVIRVGRRGSGRDNRAVTQTRPALVGITLRRPSLAGGRFGRAATPAGWPLPGAAARLARRYRPAKARVGAGHQQADYRARQSPASHHAITHCAPRPSLYPL
jgi:hypothetical protein